MSGGCLLVAGYDVMPGKNAGGTPMQSYSGGSITTVAADCDANSTCAAFQWYVRPVSIHQQILVSSIWPASIYLANCKAYLC